VHQVQHTGDVLHGGLANWVSTTREN